jgi:hypothetical protein
MKVTLAELGPNWREKFGAYLLMCLPVVSAVGEKENRGFSWLSGVSAFFSCRHPFAIQYPSNSPPINRHSKVMDALFEVEEKYSHVGASMLKTFSRASCGPRRRSGGRHTRLRGRSWRGWRRRRRRQACNRLRSISDEENLTCL